jgi:hypothetical protein
VNRLAIAKPAESSRALLIRRPELKRSKLLLNDADDDVRLRCAFNDATFVLM